MALKTREAPIINGGLTFKRRGADNKRKVLIYGKDGSGKSTYAKKYCDEHGLNPPTAGKRTPIMPYINRSFYENEFRKKLK